MEVVKRVQPAHKEKMLEKLDSVRQKVESGEVSELLVVTGENDNTYDGWWSPSPNTYGLLGFAIAMIAKRSMR